MNQIYKTSRAVIVSADKNQRYIYALDSDNPENLLSNVLRDFLETMGYSEIFPNFDNIRVGTIHPFAILLAQEVLGQNQNVNIFPSITVADSTAQEDAQILGDDYVALAFTKEDMAVVDGFRQAGELFISDSGWAKIQERLVSSGNVIGIRRRYHTQHSINFNIWADNKKITSFLYDMVGHFVSQKRVDIHENQGIDLAGMSGRRSGDINLDFGMLLYGANVQVQASMNHEAVLFDTGINTISEINANALPQYFTLT